MKLLIPIVFLAALHAAEIRWNFEGGSLDKAEKISDQHYRLQVHGQTDQDGRNRQASWYYFRVDGAPLSQITFDMTGLPGEYNYQPNKGAITKDTPPLISYDGKTWTHITEFEYDAAESRLRLIVHPKKSRFWIAHTPPYTNTELQILRKLVRKNPNAREEVIGKSVEGRELLLWTIESGRPEKTVWLMFRQHAWESGSSWTGDGAVRAILENPRGIRWKIFPVADPDGIAHGGVRFNRNGYDLNRNWDTAEPKKMPEISAQRDAIARWVKAGNSVDLFFTLHNTETSEYLEGPPGALAERFFAELKEHTAFSPSRPLSAVVPQGAKGRLNAVQGLMRDFHIPAFLMEQRIAFNPKLGHLPEIPDRTSFGRQLVEAIASTVSR